MRRLERYQHALERIANHESRADRRKRSMVDASELDDLQQIARVALEESAETLRRASPDYRGPAS